MAHTPLLSSVEYSLLDNGSEIVAEFTHDVPGRDTFQIGLFEGKNPTPVQYADSGPLVARMPNPPVNLTSVWSVRIAEGAGKNVGEFSDAIEVIVGPPQNVVLTNDGEALMLTWLPP